MNASSWTRKKLFRLVYPLMALGLILLGFLLTGGYHSVVLFFQRSSSPTEWQSSDVAPPDGLLLRIVDQEGEAVDGAYVGSSLSCGHVSPSASAPKQDASSSKTIALQQPNGKFARLETELGYSLARSSAEGMIEMESNSLPLLQSDWEKNRFYSMYVLEPERRIGRLAYCTKSDLGSEAVLKLLPLCHVTGSVTRADGLPIYRVQTYALMNGPGSPYTVLLAYDGGAEGEVDLLLPPGQYWLYSAFSIRGDAGFTWLFQDWEEVEIEEGMTKLQVDMELSRSEKPLVRRK